MLKDFLSIDLSYLPAIVIVAAIMSLYNQYGIARGIEHLSRQIRDLEDRLPPRAR